MPGDYSEDLVELVARALADNLNDPCFAERHTTIGRWEGFRAIYRQDARAALDALSSSGRLVPEGSEVREQFAAKLERSPDGRTEIRAVDDDAAVATEIVNYYDGTPRTAGGTWRWSALVVRRHRITTPWTPAEEKPNA